MEARRALGVTATALLMVKKVLRTAVEPPLLFALTFHQLVPVETLPVPVPAEVLRVTRVRFPVIAFLAIVLLVTNLVVLLIIT